MLAGYIAITASGKNSRKPKGVLSTVHRGEKSTAMATLELLLVSLSGRRWSLRFSHGFV